jgi:hypothetical protein
MATPGAPSQNLSRFDLPGYNLPLNFIPGMAKVESNGQKSVDNIRPFANALYAGSLLGLASQYAEILHHCLLTIPDRGELPLITTRELTMLQLMNQITDKPNWHVKVTNKNPSCSSKTF